MVNGVVSKGSVAEFQGKLNLFIWNLCLVIDFYEEKLIEEKILKSLS